MKTPTTVQNASTVSQAVIKRRITSTVIDMVLVTMLGLVLNRVTGTRLMGTGVTLLLVGAVYGIIQGETGASPGKAFTGLKLVNEQGDPPGTGPALIRLAAWVVDGLPCLGLLGMILIRFSPTHQRVGDTITRTFVVPARPEVEDLAVPAVLLAPGPAPERYMSGGERQDFDPIWDGKVEAYVQWDPTNKRWMKYDDAFGDWVPVEPELG